MGGQILHRYMFLGSSATAFLTARAVKQELERGRERAVPPPDDEELVCERGAGELEEAELPPLKRVRNQQLGQHGDAEPGLRRL